MFSNQNYTNSCLILNFPVHCSYIQGVHKVLHTFKILISQKPLKVETLNFRQRIMPL